MISCNEPPVSARYPPGWNPKGFVLEDGQTWIGPNPDIGIWQSVIQKRMKIPNDSER
jgi:hypothetical protein